MNEFILSMGGISSSSSSSSHCFQSNFRLIEEREFGGKEVDGRSGISGFHFHQADRRRMKGERAMDTPEIGFFTLLDQMNGKVTFREGGELAREFKSRK